MWKIMVAIICVAVLCGCGVGKPLLLNEEQVLGQVKEQYTIPLAYEVGISTSVSETEGSEGLISTTDLGEGVAEALKGNVFKEAVIGKKNGRHSFKVGVTDFEMKYAGRSGATVPSIILWTLSTPIASMFLGDETYSASGQVHASLQDTSGEEVWAADFGASVECAISDVQRGWTFWDLYVPGPFAARPNVKEASKHVLPHFYRDVQLKLLDAASSRPVPTPTYDCAIIVGVGEFPKDTKASVKYAVQDARAVGEMLKERGGEYLPDTFKEYVGQVNAAEVLGQLEELSGRQDMKLRNVVFYYAGCGQVAVKTDAVKHQLLTSTAPIDLKVLLEKLSAISCESCTMILDCGFSGKDGRCMQYKVAVAPAYPEEVMRSKQVAALFACGPGQSAYEDEKVEKGIFTDEILKYIVVETGAKKVMAREIGQSIRYPVSRRAPSCGSGRQEPVSNSADATILPAQEPEK